MGMSAVKLKLRIVVKDGCVCCLCRVCCLLCLSTYCLPCLLSCFILLLFLLS
jgi:hypothetical protein